MLSPSDMVAVETKHGTMEHWNTKSKLILWTSIYTQHFSGLSCLKQITLNKVFLKRGHLCQNEWKFLAQEGKEQGILQRQDRIQSVLGKQTKKSTKKERKSPVGHCHLAKAQAEVQPLSSETSTAAPPSCHLSSKSNNKTRVRRFFLKKAA